MIMDDEELDEEKQKMKKIKTMIIIAIIILSIIALMLLGLIIYKKNNPTNITAYIDGIRVSNFEEILDVQTDENGKTQIYVPIREFATFLNAVHPEFNYTTFKGDYNPKTEEETKCYIMREKYEVAIFTAKSKTIYKLNLQEKTNEYEEINAEKGVFLNNGVLYASSECIEKGYNIQFMYDENKKIIRIYTLDYLVEANQKLLSEKNFSNFGTLEMDEKNFNNCKSILSGLLIVQNSSKKWGVLSTDFKEFILEPQYDNIDFIAESSNFLVESYKKIGVFSKEGKNMIELKYQNITSMGQNSNLYLVKVDEQYGVVDQTGNIIIYPQYEKIGIDVKSYTYNDIKNGYILLNKLIPVQQNSKWAFYTLEGKQVSNGFKYDMVGCSKVKSGNNISGLLQIPERNVIVVGDSTGKYSFMSLNGDDSMLPFLFEYIYIKSSEGNNSYWMTYKDKDYNVLEFLKQNN